MIKDAIRKSLGKFLFPSTYSTLLMPRTRFNYAKEVNGYSSSIIMACVGWIQRTFPEAPQIVEKRDSDGEWEEMDHPLTDLMNEPNPFYDGLLLQQAFIADLVISGNAYLLKVRSGAGRPVQLWWTPSTLITPKWPEGGTEFISHYDYFPGGTPVKIDITDVVHYRLGLDHDNPRKGRSPLQSLLREVFTDDEAANMTAALLKNMGVPGLVISPTQESMMPQDAEAVRERVKQLTTGDRRGEPIILSSSTKVDTFGFNPQEMNLKDLRRIPEERISAVLGVPAIVAGLGAGLDRSTFSNMQEAREMAYESGIIPLQRIVASQTKHQLLKEYTDDLVNYRVSYDVSEIRVLQEDEDKLSVRTIQQVNGGVCKVTDAQRILGLPIDDSQDFYLRSYTSLPVRSVEEEKTTELPSVTLTGVQIEAAQNVIDNFIGGRIPESVAVELLIAVGLPRENAERMIADSRSFTPKPTEPMPEEPIPPAKSIKKTWDEEQKTAYWKKLDRERIQWWGVAQDKIEPLYEAEAKAVIKAIESGGKPDKAIKSLKKKWTDEIEQLTYNIVEHFGKEQKAFNPASALIRAWIAEHATESVTSILATNLEDVKYVIAQGTADNLTVPQIAKSLRQFYTDRSPYKAMRVARTEVAQSAGFAQHESAKEAGWKKHTWLSSRDDRVRDSHSAIDGEEQPIGKPYSNGLMFPGDPGGDPAESIMCRCAEQFH